MIASARISREKHLGTERIIYSNGGRIMKAIITIFAISISILGTEAYASSYRSDGYCHCAQEIKDGANTRYKYIRTGQYYLTQTNQWQRLTNVYTTWDGKPMWYGEYQCEAQCRKWEKERKFDNTTTALNCDLTPQPQARNTRLLSKSASYYRIGLLFYSPVFSAFSNRAEECAATDGLCDSNAVKCGGPVFFRKSDGTYNFYCNNCLGNASTKACYDVCKKFQALEESKLNPRTFSCESPNYYFPVATNTCQRCPMWRDLDGNDSASGDECFSSQDGWVAAF
jgi:hypothetical protein